MADDEDQNIGFQDPDHEDMPSEMKDHWLAAFRHKAGLGPHPGPYTGPQHKSRNPDEPSETDLQSAREEPPIGEEVSAQKMHAAQTGGAGTGLGPTEAEQALIKQRSALQQAAGTQDQIKAAQAQGAQTSATPPPAPTGPAGVTAPYSAQAGAVGGSGNPPAPAPPAAPAAPAGPDQGPPPEESA